MSEWGIVYSDLHSHHEGFAVTLLKPPASQGTSIMPTCSPSRVVFALLLTLPLSAAPPLHQRIDQLMSQSSTKVAAPASDAELLRRATLDFHGTIPTSTEARTFLSDNSQDKRTKLIERLLDAPEYARHFSEIFDLMLLERRAGKNVPTREWTEFLRTALLKNRPWNEIVHEILSADGVDVKKRGPAKFYFVRNAEPNLVTKDISRLFLGMNVECAQCHDHPVVEEYKQHFYYGIYAFVNRSYIVRDAKLKRNVLSEKGVGEVTFTSVFDPKKVTKKTGPRLPYRAMLKEPKLVKGKEYKVKPAKNRRGVPTFSRRALLGPELTRLDYQAFARNLANRLWAHLMGRGLVDPIDMHHPDNPPSHPKVLQTITEEVVNSKFNIKHILRELALTKVYQRSSALPSGMKARDEGSFDVMHLKAIPPEALGRTILQATGMTDIYRRSLRTKLNEGTLHAQIAKLRAPLVRALAGDPGQIEEFVPTLEQALFVANNSLIQTWITPRGGNLVDRLLKIKDPKTMAEELYLGVLTRMPSSEESKDLIEYVKTTKKSDALQDYVWALLASAEMRFNH